MRPARERGRSRLPGCGISSEAVGRACARSHGDSPGPVPTPSGAGGRGRSEARAGSCAQRLSLPRPARQPGAVTPPGSDVSPPAAAAAARAGGPATWAAPTVPSPRAGRSGRLPCGGGALRPPASRVV
ncbi:unnamed protein product [Lepidochelys kempii]